MLLNKFDKVLLIILSIISSFSDGQECPEIYVPPYAEKPRECQTSVGSTCLITCPDDFDIIGKRLFLKQKSLI